ncbi:thyroid hormone receptor-associated protein-like protein [Dinothrombium tinctorium]|uniref:Thyroid hormone receptor-associated protein-like protein n=1 Tax=Dinothrombium tinctorium TaxID=1965070 RepID=A0A3S3P2N9_9ACAR|nr:thyroid hormone receptor-associated protein-like protein [Dinothrombium tinctorium]
MGLMDMWLYEKRPLKKPKLGPPDVYPQDPKQKEVSEQSDELTAINVKQGFLTHPTIQDEYGSARNSNVNASKFGTFFSSLLTKKQELNTFQDTARKKPQITKECIWLVTQRNKNTVDLWFKELNANSKTLTQLGRKVPIFNKKEEVFMQLYDSNVPMFKACWYIKISSTYSIALSESGNKSKKRQLPDPSQEWTTALCKFLRELYQKLCENYHNNSINSIFGPTTNSNAAGNSNAEMVQTLYKQWSYCTQLARHLFEEGLLDQHDFLLWIMDLLEKIKSPDDSVMSIIIPLLLQYVEDFCQSESLSRRLAYHCAKKLSQLVIDNSEKPNNASESNSENNSSPNSSNPLINCFKELLGCPHHRNTLYGLSTVIQVITLKCPTSLVWHNIGEGRASPSLSGSPLDHLPCPPSHLPMPPKPGNAQLRQELRTAEEQICARSKAVEMKWCSERLQQTTPGQTINRLLNALDALDRHCFGKIESANCLDTLYSKIFVTATAAPTVNPNEPSKNISEILSNDEPIIKLLCEWAVTSKRTGEHRALVVAKLLEKRQNELLMEKDSESEKEEKEQENSNAKDPQKSPVTNGDSSQGIQAPIYQNLLMSFLDTQAPVLDEQNPSAENKLSFANLVLLFGELIRCDVFSHDAYMCTLISRGQFANSPTTSSITPQTADPKSNQNVEPSLTRFVPNLSANPSLPMLSANPPNLGVPMDQNSCHRPNDTSLPMFEPMGDSHGKAELPSLSWDVDIGSQHMDMDDSRIDADLDKILQNIKEGQQNNMNDQTDILLPDSVSSDKEDENVLHSAFGRSENSAKKSAQRHLLYTTHFPLPQDETTSHDCNQRHVLLYGVGKARDDARHSVKKVTKEILKLFNRKSSMDISEGGKIKKPAIKEGFNFEAALTRFQSLSYFDQHVVISSCSSACIEMFNGVATGSSNYIPLIESIAFLFDLMEMSFDVHELIEFVIQLLKELVDVELQLQQKCPILAGNYCTTIGLYIVGVLYRYHNCLLVSLEETVAVFDGLYKLVKHVANPADCSSAERCILCYLHDLYNACNHLRSKYHDMFQPVSSKIKQTICSSVAPSSINLLWNTSCMIEYINNPKLKIDVNHIKQLHENSAYRYSFVCNAIHAVAMARDPNRLNEISVLCAELTARCSLLSSEWLGVLQALCRSSKQDCGFMDVLAQIDVADLSIHDNLAVFTSILIARRSFLLQDFLIHCALPSLVTCAGVGNQFAERGARLSCHLLLSLFRTSEPPLSSSVLLSTPATTLYSLTSPGPSTLVNSTANPTQRSLYVIKHPCDRYLLAAAHSGMKVEAVLTVLKAILVLGDSIEVREAKSKSEVNQNKEISISEILGPLDDGDFGDFGLLQFPGSKPRVDGSAVIETTNLGEFAKHALKQICSQEWVHEKCLRELEMPDKQNLLMDPMLTSKQAQQLLQMICHPKGIPNTISDSEMDQRQQISKILQSLDEWTIRVSWLQLQLMYAQCCRQTQVTSQTDVNTWLDNVARATIDFFQNSSEESSKNSQFSQNSQTNSKQMNNRNFNTTKMSNEESSGSKDTRVWLVAPLVSKLPAAVHGKILRVAANVLEAGNWMSSGCSSSQNSYSYSKSKDRGFQQQNRNSNTNVSNSSMLLSYPPFLSLVLMCLKGQDEQRESLLNSLYSQLQQAVHDRPNDDTKTKLNIQEGLQLRLSLVGGMFDMIQKSSSLMDWAVLLLQLISYGVVDPQLNYELFTIVLDMLCVLIHTTQATDSSEAREETRKQHQNLIKKLKKELATERFGLGVALVRQLLPIPKQQCEVITCEAMGSLIDTKGNKIAGFDSIDKKQGLQVAEIQKVSPWDLIEGHKNPAPLSWTWFSAVKFERKPLRAEENHHYNAWHTHSQRKPTSYYLEPPPLPPEDTVEPLPMAPIVPPPIIEKQIQPPMIPPPQNLLPMPIPDDPMKRERDTPTELTLRGLPKKNKPPRRRRQPKNVMTPPAQQPQTLRLPYDGYSGHPSAQNTQQWYQGPQQPGPSPHQGPPQQGYYHQGPPMGPTQTRYDRPNGGPKAVLNSILRARQPGGGAAQYMNQNSGPTNAASGMTGPSNGPPPPHVYQARQQMMMQRQMRPGQQQPAPMGVPQNQMYQMQTGNPQGAPSQVPQNSMHHMTPQTQTNYGGQPTNMPYNSMQMQIDQMQSHPQQGYPQQQTMINSAMRAQMHQHQHQQQHPQQFMQPRSQFVTAPNVTMSQMAPNQNFANPGSMQTMPQNTATGPSPHMRQQMQQQMLQRQLSSGKPQQHNPYQQGPY